MKRFKDNLSKAEVYVNKVKLLICPNKYFCRFPHPDSKQSLKNHNGIITCASGVLFFAFFSCSLAYPAESEVPAENFLVRPWAIGQTVTLQTKTFINNKLVNTETETDSVVGQETIKGKKYFWFEMDHQNANGKTVVIENQVRQNNGLNFLNAVNPGHRVLNPRRILIGSVATGDTKTSMVSEMNLSPDLISTVENGENPSELKDDSADYTIKTNVPVTVEAGDLSSSEFFKTLKSGERAGNLTAGSTGAVSQFSDNFGSPKIPIWGIVKKTNQTFDPKIGTTRIETELLSYADSGAISKIQVTSGSLNAAIPVPTRDARLKFLDKSFTVQPWVVGQTVAYQTKTYDAGQLTDVESDTFSIVGQETVKGKDYFWIEIERNLQNGTTIFQKMQVRKPEPFDFEGAVGNPDFLLNPRRKVQEVIRGGTQGSTIVSEFEMPATQVSQIENEAGVSLIGHFGYLLVPPQKTIQVPAGTFKSFELYRSYSAQFHLGNTGVANGSTGKTLQFSDKLGSAEIPIFGLVMGVDQMEGNNGEAVRRETQLQNFSSSGAFSKITSTPVVVPMTQQKKNQENLSKLHPDLFNSR